MIFMGYLMLILSPSVCYKISVCYKSFIINNVKFVLSVLTVAESKWKNQSTINVLLDFLEQFGTVNACCLWKIKHLIKVAKVA